jgi:hypothetical protein
MVINGANFSSGVGYDVGVDFTFYIDSAPTKPFRSSEASASVKASLV